MTREEAIAILEEEAEFLYGNDKPHNRIAFDMAISALSELGTKANEAIKPYVELAHSVSAENKGEWIPVSERLPKEREWYLAVFKEKDTNFHLIPRVADYIGHGENKWRWIDEEGLTQEYLDLLECVAWMPLPEPYKAERGE